ncbi:MAG: ABC transporter ATP-binding protein [Anaerolineales bacterium]|nr:ABC transporter ATP-binding protein [Anaerolineales bacterium]
MATLALNAVNKYFRQQHAVKDVSFEVKEGELISLLGPSGCGKTTTLRMIAGFVEVSSGTVELAGRDVTYDPPYRRNTGMVFQNYALFPHMSVSQNIAFGLRMRKAPKAEIPGRVQRALNLIQMAGYEQRLPRELSGGQQQRVALARALAIEPAVLLLDEPLSNLDAKLREDMRLEIRQIQQQVGITSIFVTHDQEEALTLSDRIIVMNEGAIMESGDPLEIYSRPASAFAATFIGHTNLVEGTVQAHEGRHWVVKSASGLVLRCAQRDGLAAGDRAMVLWRQERMRLQVHESPPEPDANSVAAEVVLVTFLGPTIEYICRASGHELRVRRPNEGSLPRLQPGHSVRLVVDPADCILIKY